MTLRVAREGQARRRVASSLAKVLLPVKGRWPRRQSAGPHVDDPPPRTAMAAPITDLGTPCRQDNSGDPGQRARTPGNPLGLIRVRLELLLLMPDRPLP